jgi:hypothetical protein
MPTIPQHLNHFAVADAAMAAFFNHAFELLAERFQLLKANLHLLKLRACNGVGCRATGFRVI